MNHYTGFVVQVLGILVFFLGLFISFHVKGPTVISFWRVIQESVDSFGGGDFFKRTKVEIRPLDINTPNPNPEIGHDSEYEINIITPHPIAKFLVTIKVPDSVWRPEEPFSLYSETVTGNSAWYENYQKYPVQNGYATIEIPNAAGEYHLTFGNTKPEQLTIKDISL
jgi:hypothetical protein